MKSIIIKTILSLAFLAFAIPSEASHFRYGTISYQVLSETGSGAGKQTVVQFSIKQAWRADYFGAVPSVGTTYPAGSEFEFSINFGDGSSAFYPYTVTSVNIGENWFAGGGTVTHTYTGNIDVTAYFSSCCRISTLVNNADESERTETVVTLSQTNNSSPTSSLPPIVNVPDGAALFTFNLNATDPNAGDVLSYSLSTGAQSLLFVTSPNFYTSVNSSTGLVSLNTTVGGVTDGQLYAIQFMISDNKGATTPLDFIIKITSAAPNNPPTFVAPTPANNSVINATVGVPMSFTIAASDVDVIDVVTLNASGVPAGAVFSPGAAANPVSTVFSWTPTLADVGGNSISFTATDNNAGQAITNVNISVAAGGIPCSPISITFSASGLKPFWAPATDPYTFYYGLVDAKRINANVSGGVGPYTYVWSNSGTPALLQRPYYPDNSIDLYRPLAATTVTVDVTDAGTGCTHTASVNIGWDGQYHCSTPQAMWSVVICDNGATQCVPWGTAKNLLKANAPGVTLGTCVVKTDQVATATNFNVYPNPSSGLFTLEMPIAANSKGSVEVMDVNGRALYSESIDVQEGVLYHTLDLGTLPNGIYIVRVATDNEFATERIQIIR